jgi:hypothetical protein
MVIQVQSVTWISENTWTSLTKLFVHQKKRSGKIAYISHLLYFISPRPYFDQLSYWDVNAPIRSLLPL